MLYPNSFERIAQLSGPKVTQANPDGSYELQWGRHEFHYWIDDQHEPSVDIDGIPLDRVWTDLPGMFGMKQPVDVLEQLNWAVDNYQYQHRQAIEYRVDPSGTVEDVRPDRPSLPHQPGPSQTSVRTFGALRVGQEFTMDGKRWKKQNETQARSVTGQQGRPKMITIPPEQQVL
jgi:hypothetical protein